jgi:hypothetical protein
MAIFVLLYHAATQTALSHAKKCQWWLVTDSSKIFTMPKRLEIGYKYLDRCINQWPNGRPSQQQLALKAKISQSSARKIIMELKNTGSLTDPPELTNSENMHDQESWLYVWRNLLVPIVSMLHTLQHYTVVLLFLQPSFPNGSRLASVGFWP